MSAYQHWFTIQILDIRKSVGYVNEENVVSRRRSVYTVERAIEFFFPYTKRKSTKTVARVYTRRHVYIHRASDETLWMNCCLHNLVEIDSLAIIDKINYYQSSFPHSVCTGRIIIDSWQETFPSNLRWFTAAIKQLRPYTTFQHALRISTLNTSFVFFFFSFSRLD